jgi:curved DNA-binding protein CbpA
MSQVKEESYYKVLDTTAKISQRRIKEKYLEAVRKYPPETHPNEFEKIREAFETLKDPIKRKQYDLSRKYGGKLEKMIEDAFKALIKNHHKKAIKIFNNILGLDSENLLAQIGLMHGYVLTGDLNKGKEYFKKAISSPMLSIEDLDPAYVYTKYASSLLEAEQIQEGYDILEEAFELFPDSAASFSKILSVASIMLGKEERALEVAEMAIPLETEESLDDIECYLTWIYVISQTESWSRLSKVQTRFRKFLKNLDEEDKEEAAYVLMDEARDSYEEQRYRLAEVFLDFAKIVTKDHSGIKEMHKKVMQLARVEKELGRIIKDDSIFPLVIYHTMIWFFDDEFHPAVLHMKNSIPAEFWGELIEKKEWFAAGILKLKKKYPAIYLRFKEEWDDLFDDLTKNFNREMKRELKKMK